MLTMLELKSFRGFQHLKLDRLSRINLISGKNNTGKTALLEAVFLQLGPLQPQLATSFSHRGELSGARTLPLGLRYADEWPALFHDRATNNSIELSCEIDSSVRQRLVISIRDARTEVIQSAGKGGESASEGGSATTQEPTLELVYRVEGPNATQIEAVATPITTGTTMGLLRESLSVTRTSTILSWLPKATLLGTDRQSRTRLAEQFSALKDKREHGPIEDALRALEPRLKEIEIRVSAKRAELAADVGLTQLVPLRMMGEGVTRVTEILLAIFRTPGGVVLIDEIENGLHYSVLPTVWDAVISAARRAGAQVFATTHSFECIRAAYEAAVANPNYELGVHRLDRIDGAIAPVTYDRDMLRASFSIGLETR
jgi:hypothetical protein